MQIRIREAGDADKQTFWRATLETVWNDIPDDERVKLDRSEFEDYFRQAASSYLEDPRNRMFVAEDEGGRFLGYTLLGQLAPFYSSRPHGFVYDIYVAEHARRQGVARRLLEFAFGWFRNQGLWKVKLEVASNNVRARPLYEQLGFRAERLVMGKPLK